MVAGWEAGEVQYCRNNVLIGGLQVLQDNHMHRPFHHRRICCKLTILQFRATLYETLYFALMLPRNDHGIALKIGRVVLGDERPGDHRFGTGQLSVVGEADWTQHESGVALGAKRFRQDIDADEPKKYQPHGPDYDTQPGDGASNLTIDKIGHPYP